MIFCGPFLRSLIRLFISSIAIQHNRECRLLGNFDGEDGNFRFELVTNRLSNSLRGKIKWIDLSKMMV